MSAAPPPAGPPPGQQPSHHRGRRRELAATLGVVAIGGVVGAVLRYEATLIWPDPIGSFPTTVLLVNLLGCLVIGVFMVIITEMRSTHRLIRPFFGTGVLGGFTTFSTYSLDILEMVRAGQPGPALAYLFLTALGAMAAVFAGMVGMRRLAIAFGWGALMAVDYLLVVGGAAIGAPLRYLTDRWSQLHLASRFPWGIFAVNVIGSMIIGVLAGAALVGAESTPAGLLLGTGLCGALTTYSTLSYETAQLIERRSWLGAAGNLFGSIIAGLAAVTAGYLLAAAVVG